MTLLDTWCSDYFDAGCCCSSTPAWNLWSTHLLHHHSHTKNNHAGCCCSSTTAWNLWSSARCRYQTPQLACSWRGPRSMWGWPRGAPRCAVCRCCGVFVHVTAPSCVAGQQVRLACFLSANMQCSLTGWAGGICQAVAVHGLARTCVGNMPCVVWPACAGNMQCGCSALVHSAQHWTMVACLHHACRDYVAVEVATGAVTQLFATKGPAAAMVAISTSGKSVELVESPRKQAWFVCIARQLPARLL